MPISISKFLREDGCNYASYDNYRKIASACDGMKPSSRKCLYTVLKNNVVEPKKVSQLKSDAASLTQYLHGDAALEGVLVGMAQDFAGTNNVPLLKRKGAFGNRLKPQAAAGRYIFTCKEDYLDKIFRKEDTPILTEQVFEGAVIEPKFYIPVLPMLLINGSVGLTTGFSQNILPRNPKEITKWILNKLDGKSSSANLKPWFKGFTGTVDDLGEGKWKISGVYTTLKNGDIEITELPPSYTLEDYTAILDRLEDDKEIRSYKDLSDEGRFHFIVKPSRTGKAFNPEKLKLSEIVTEKYTSFDADNKIREFVSAGEILEYYFQLRFDYYQKRKEWLIGDLSNKISELKSRMAFVEGVVKKKIVISDRTDEEINTQLDNTKNVIKLNNSYDYLLAMPIRSLTKEKVEKLRKEVETAESSLDSLKKKSQTEMWKEDINNLKEIF